MKEISGAAVLDSIAETLVVQEKYSSKEEALRALAQTAVQTKIDHYRRRIQRLQRKYGMDFVSYTRELEGRASPEQEDDWFSWRSAISMMEDWKTINLSLGHEPLHR